MLMEFVESKEQTTHLASRTTMQLAIPTRNLSPLPENAPIPLHAVSRSQNSMLSSGITLRLCNARCLPALVVDQKSS